MGDAEGRHRGRLERAARARRDRRLTIQGERRRVGVDAASSHDRHGKEPAPGDAASGDGEAHHDRLAEAVKRALAPDLLREIHGPLWHRIAARWRGIFRKLRPLGGASEGNRVTVYADGDDAFRAMWAAIEAARSRVWLEIYTFHPDAVGRRTRDALTAAARRGCDVRVLFDHVGSPRLSEGFFDPLLRAGGAAEPYSPVWPWRQRGPLLFRNHRKITVTDTIGFCGGMNVSEEYAGPSLGSGRFRDTHLRLEGPCVYDLAELFSESWEEAADDRLPPIPHPAPIPDGFFVQVLDSDARRERRAIQRALRHTVGRAVHNAFITTPYFVPPRRLRRAILRAADRGVDVRILTAGLSDAPVVRWAGQHIYDGLLRAGVRIYELFGQTLHAKTVTIDGLYSAVGSFNLDRWSDRRNLEVKVAILDPALAQRLEDAFHEDLTNAREIRLEDWERRALPARVLQWAAYQVMRL